MIKLTIFIDENVFSALQIISEVEKRDVRDQASYIIEEDLIGRKLVIRKQAKPIVSTETPLQEKPA